MNVEIVGLYRTPPSPCGQFPARDFPYLVELRLTGCSPHVDLFDFGQTTSIADFTFSERPLPSEAMGRSAFFALQAPAHVHVLDGEGRSLDASETLTVPAADGELRVAFFVFHLDPDRPLETPLGPFDLPEPTPVPARLATTMTDVPT